MSEGKLYLFSKKMILFKNEKKQLKHHFIKDNLQGHLSIKEKDGLNQEELGHDEEQNQIYREQGGQLFLDLTGHWVFRFC